MSVRSLSASEIKDLVKRAHLGHDAWLSSAGPEPTRSVTVPVRVKGTDEQSRCISVKLLPGGRHVVAGFDDRACCYDVVSKVVIADIPVEDDAECFDADYDANGNIIVLTISGTSPLM